MWILAYPMLPIFLCSSLSWRFTRIRIFRWRSLLTMKNSSDSDRVTVTPVATSRKPKSEFLSGALLLVLPIVLSRHMKSQQLFPIWKDLHSCGGAQRTDLHPFGWPLSHTHNWHKSGPGTYRRSCSKLTPYMLTHSPSELAHTKVPTSEWVSIKI